MNTKRGLAVVSGRSGEGKTLATMGLLSWLDSHDHPTQSFKIGPDFIDPLLHSKITGHPAPCLDGFFRSPEQLRELFNRYSPAGGYSIVEGVMGLLDGRREAPGLDSTADVLETLKLPYLLVLSARGRSHSLVSELAGFLQLCPELTCRGVLVNRFKSDRHREMIRDSLREFDPELPVLFLPEDDRFRLPERHLGLDSNTSDARFSASVEAIRDSLEQQSNGVEQILPDPEPQTADTPSKSKPTREPIARIGIARDEAFQFYYSENFRALREAGAKLIEISPLRDRKLPKKLDGLYLGGGYPEEHARQLAENRSFRDDLQARLQDGLLTFAECGGLLYLGTTISTTKGEQFPGIGWFDFGATLEKTPVALGYVSGTLYTDEFLAGDDPVPARGHEFHYSQIKPAPTSGILSLDRGTGFGSGTDGLLKGNCLGCFSHLYFPACGSFASRWVQRASNSSDRSTKPVVPGKSRG